MGDSPLIAANIRIYPTPNVQLYLRRSALDIPLFKDAQAGTFNHVSIVLVDSERLFPQDVFQNTPAEGLGLYRVYRRLFEEEVKPKQEKRIESLEQWIEENEGKWLRGEIEEDMYRTVKNYYKEELMKGRKRLSGFDAPLGIFMDGRTYKEEAPQFLEGESEDLSSSIAIYMVVGGKMKPHPDQSYPSREKFPDRDDVDSFISAIVGDYRVKSESVTAGFVIHHEVAHYETNHVANLLGSSEYQTDTKALDRIGQAKRDLEDAKKRKRIVNSSGSTSLLPRISNSYPFIFVTNEGLIITKNLNTDSGERKVIQL